MRNRKTPLRIAAGRSSSGAPFSLSLSLSLDRTAHGLPFGSYMVTKRRRRPRAEKKREIERERIKPVKLKRVSSGSEQWHVQGRIKKRTSRSNGADNNPVRNSIADENPMKLGGGGGGAKTMLKTR